MTNINVDLLPHKNSNIKGTINRMFFFSALTDRIQNWALFIEHH
jgi:hypothetical protein